MYTFIFTTKDAWISSGSNHVTGVTSAIQTQIDTKAPLASPNFSGTPQISGTNIPVVTGHIANLSAGANAFKQIHDGTCSAPKIILLP